MPKKRAAKSFNDLQVRFGATLRAQREKLGLTQQELADRSDLHRTYIADVERGSRNISLTSAARLLYPLNLSLGAFFATLERRAKKE